MLRFLQTMLQFCGTPELLSSFRKLKMDNSGKELTFGILWMFMRSHPIQKS
jgi:hypothetical protein